MKDFFRHNGILILVIAVLLALITLVVTAFTGGVAAPISNAVNVITTPVRNGLNSLVNWVEGIYDYSFQYDQLLAENEQLKKRIAEMEEEIRQAESANTENDRFRNLLNFQTKHKEFQMEPATVTAAGASNWESTFTISKGTSSGVEPDDCVVDEYGNFVGIITEAGLNWSTVTTLIDTDIELGGLIGRTDGAAILEGDFTLMGQGRLKLSYLPENTQLVAGDEVLTSGKGGVYPSGLVVGAIESVHTDVSGMSRYAVVKPAADLDDLQQVFVIKAFDIVE
ncbi:rod shape-determining protein MreC [Pseudoflavonifractor sp. BIOML-A6]|nr:MULTISPECIES: rod shape-determining protein MreC [unclassified Pseudoflavonifractor]MTQ97979.1 rod shape-determining protein MreC [Pseudoflavonifractor sp. BIOML-A16]MTR05564.1 rod shape-determining protein MreC [Pseudoflavonifractor sp. BIOML-A15]MTR74248.1 rod shape-determining protein MreC [Pseudoflavonifractor sp. BIOML-A18]MTS64966.1 rod shape-determining protein MreC [Pseudoflavonifractor sp. BIOML-A5]MTS71864.1 rod shape-determining protein MreC [Pseudoflavonifractor sp. BIOML-A8]MT